MRSHKKPVGPHAEAYRVAKFDKNAFDEDYFLHGKETGKSLYENYRWLPELTIPMAIAMRQHLGIETTDTILDFGCSRGYTVRAFREMGYNAFGVDCSQWAIDNCDESVKDFVLREEPNEANLVDWVIAKDVLEHVDHPQQQIIRLMKCANKGVFAVVPLAISDHERYVVLEYESDVTHLHRFTLATWAAMFIQVGWAVTAQYAVEGVKQNYAKFERGNGFLTCKRIS